MLLETFKDIVITDTGRYDLSEGTLFPTYVSQAQRMIEGMLDAELMDSQSKLISVDSITFYGDLSECLSIEGAYITSLGETKQKLAILSFDDLLEMLPENAFTSSDTKSTPLYLCRTTRLDSIDGLDITPVESGFLIYPVPNKSYSLRILGLFRFTDVLLDLDGTHPLLATYSDLLILGTKARMEFGLRNVEGYRQYQNEMREYIDNLRRKKIYEESFSESLTMEG